MKELDIVARLSYNMDVYFRIKKIEGNVAYLEGISTRLVADSSLDDLVLISDEKLNLFNENENIKLNNVIKSYKSKISHITGKILHYDSDRTYLDKSLRLYQALDIYAKGVLIEEKLIEAVILDDIRKVKPDIIVITGHDSYNKKDLKSLSSYRNSLSFVKAILKVREYYSIDDIIIYAGACGSNFEALIAAGANFASSIDRTNIEAYDPAIAAVIASITPHDKIIDIKNLYNFSKMERGSIGGIESYGRMRLLLR